MSSNIIGMILVTKHYCIYTITSISDPVGKMSWYLNLLFRLKIKSLIDHTWAKRGVSVCFHYLKVNTCNVYGPFSQKGTNNGKDMAINF